MAYEKSKVSKAGEGSLDRLPLVGFEYCHQVSSVPGDSIPASDLAEGELALNSADGTLFYRTPAGTVGQIQSSAGSGSGSPQVVSLTYASTLNTDASAGDIFDVTLTGNATLANPTNPVDGKTLRWRVRQDGTGSRAVTLGNKFNIPSSATSPLPFSTAANKMDVLAATYHAGRDKWDVIAFVMGY
jgi:hypothetical protein